MHDKTSKSVFVDLLEQEVCVVLLPSITFKFPKANAVVLNFLHRFLKSIPVFIWIICKWHLIVFFTYSALLLIFYVTKYKQKICSIIKFKHRHFLHSLIFSMPSVIVLKRNVFDIFSLILITCHTILETKVKWYHTIIRVLDTTFVHVLSFIFRIFFELICHVKTEVF